MLQVMTTSFSLPLSESEGEKLRISALVAALHECTRSGDLQRGKRLHSEAIPLRGIFVENTIINMYARCGSMADAQQVFDGMKHRNSVSWNCLIRGYVQNERSEVALEFFDRMKQSPAAPDARTFVAALAACSSLASDEDPRKQYRWLARGRKIHSQALSSGCCDMFVESTLVDLYARCGFMEEARELFDRMPHRSVVSWNCLVRGYAKCGEMEHARRVFEEMVHRNVVTWFCLVKGYVDNGENQVALEVFDRMLREKQAPDARLVVVALSACSALAEEEEWLEKGIEIHQQALRNSCCNKFVESTLVEMYSKFKRMDLARRVFDRIIDQDQVSWNCLIQGYSKCGEMRQARGLFDRMMNRSVVSWHCLIRGYVENGESEVALQVFQEMDCVPDTRVYIAALTACSSLAQAEDGSRSSEWFQVAMRIHREALRNNCCTPSVEAMVVDVFAKCGRMREAQVVFDGMMSDRSTGAWNSLIRGYVDDGQNHLGLELIEELKQQSGCHCDVLTYVAALLACGNLTAVEKGEGFHQEIIDRGFENNLVLATCLIEFYGRCGKMSRAEEVFESTKNINRDLMCWNALLRGYSRHGNLEALMKTVERMKESGVALNGITFTYILTTLAHAGMSAEVRKWFEAMGSEFGVTPGMEHFACVVDSLGRSEECCVEEALRFVRGMPVRASVVVWHSLLSACRKWGNVEVGRVAFEEVMRLDEKDLCAFLVMAEIYGAAGMEEERMQVLKMKQNEDEMKMKNAPS